MAGQKAGSKRTLENLYQQRTTKALNERGFMIAEDRIQLLLPAPIMSLGTEITLTSVWPAKPVINFPNPVTLNSLQSFLGILTG